MKIIFHCILILWCSGTLHAQQSSDLRLLSTVDAGTTAFTVDNLDNIFLLNKDGQVKKLQPNGDSLGVFNDIRRYGTPTALDAGNPLKLLLFYKAFGSVVVLDRFLSVRNTIDLRRQNILQPTAIGQAYDNGIWVYDVADAKLKHVDEEGKVTANTTDFRLLFDVVPSPTHIIDQDKLVYMYDPQAGLFIFDYYGSLKSKISLLGWQDFQVIGDRIFGRKNNTLLSYQVGTAQLKEQPLSVLNGVQQSRISTKNLYCLKDGLILVYAL